MKAKLTSAEVAAARLYTGPSYEPINAALRTKNVGPWATTIALLYSAVLKLSELSKPARVYRGVKEDKMVLPNSFLNAAADEFAGGVELAFMSTTLARRRGGGATASLDYLLAEPTLRLVRAVQLFASISSVQHLHKKLHFVVTCSNKCNKCAPLYRP